MIAMELSEKLSKMLQITKGAHSQSGKEVTKIVVLGHSFDYSDKKGYNRYAMISAEFAKEIISKIPHVVYQEDKVKLFENPAHEFSLSWDCYSPNKTDRSAGAKDHYELRIHFGHKSDHIWTSMKLLPTA